MSTTGIPCKICSRPAAFFDVVDFNKCAGGYPFGPSGVTVPWHRCRSCEFVFTPFFDDWGHEDFAAFVYNADYALVDPDYTARRPRETAELVTRRLANLGDLRILDYGSGSGAFAAYMAQAGRPGVATYDPFSQPVRPQGPFDLVTCFEVLEHSPTPLATLQDIVALAGDNCCIVLGQALHPPDIERIRANWWYCAPRNGHCSTFSEATLSALAARCGLTFHRSTNPHALSRGVDPVVAELARRFGNRFHSEYLAAASDGDPSEWHPPERVGGFGCRWTRRNEINWSVALPRGGACTLQVRIPYFMEAHPGFAEASQVVVNGTTAKLTVRPRMLVAEAVGIDGKTATVTLRTPELRKASGRDSRELGLLIEIAPSPA